jgi:hypothetical protein
LTFFSPIAALPLPAVPSILLSSGTFEATVPLRETKLTARIEDFWLIVTHGANETEIISVARNVRRGASRGRREEPHRARWPARGPPIAELCRREGIAEHAYSWSKECLRPISAGLPAMVQAAMTDEVNLDRAGKSDCWNDAPTESDRDEF